MVAFSHLCLIFCVFSFAYVCFLCLSSIILYSWIPVNASEQGKYSLATPHFALLSLRMEPFKIHLLLNFSSIDLDVLPHKLSCKDSCLMAYRRMLKGQAIKLYSFILVLNWKVFIGWIQPGLTLFYYLLSQRILLDWCSIPGQIQSRVLKWTVSFCEVVNLGPISHSWFCVYFHLYDTAYCI